MDNLEPEDLPCCPFCDNAILCWQSSIVYHQDGVKCLVHTDCVHPEEEEES